MDFWHAVEQYALDTVRHGTAGYMPCGIAFGRDADYLYIVLPSGRRLYYYRPEVRVNDLGRDAVPDEPAPGRLYYTFPYP